MNQVEREGDIPRVCRCGEDFDDGSAPNAELAGQRKLLEEHQTRSTLEGHHGHSLC